MHNKYTYKALQLHVKLMLAVCAWLLFSCTAQRKERGVERSFYYWKSTFHFSPFELSRLDSLGVNTLYVKFFDVDWDPQQQKPVPVAKLQGSGDAWPVNKWAIPVVFITNSCIQQIDSGRAKELAEHITSLLYDLKQTVDIRCVPELQIDCDWSATTKNTYFYLLQQIRQMNPGKMISATIRLHQVKFADRTGIPPADRGLLMCYNMGNLKNPATGNSILETSELKKYTGKLEYYPLPLDAAFPIFNWKVLFRDNVYKGLVQDLPDEMLTPLFTRASGNRFHLLKDTLLQGYDLRRGDVLRNEESDYKELLETAETISRSIKNTSLRVSLYHLDSVLLNKYSLHELETVFNRLH